MIVKFITKGSTVFAFLTPLVPFKGLSILLLKNSLIEEQSARGSFVQFQMC